MGEGRSGRGAQIRRPEGRRGRGSASAGQLKSGFPSPTSRSSSTHALRGRVCPVALGVLGLLGIVVRTAEALPGGFGSTIPRRPRGYIEVFLDLV